MPKIWPKCICNTVYYNINYIYTKFVLVQNAFCGIIHQTVLLHSKSKKAHSEYPFIDFNSGQESHTNMLMNNISIFLLKCEAIPQGFHVVIHQMVWT